MVVAGRPFSEHVIMPDGLKHISELTAEERKTFMLAAAGPIKREFSVNLVITSSDPKNSEASSTPPSQKPGESNRKVE